MIKLPLNLVYLKYFYDAVLNESISRSAKLNHVSQSAVSQGISKLERSLGAVLISHQPNCFKVTERGKKLFTSAKDIFKAIQKTEDDISDEEQETVTFGCTHSFGLTCLPKYIKLARKYLPNVHLNFRLVETLLNNNRKHFGYFLQDHCVFSGPLTRISTLLQL